MLYLAYVYLISKYVFIRLFLKDMLKTGSYKSTFIDRFESIVIDFMHRPNKLHRYTNSSIVIISGICIPHM